jgi:hypothetical protein
MDTVDRFKSEAEIRNYITIYKSKEEQFMFAYFQSYFNNVLFGDENDEELYKKYILADTTGELHALAVKSREFFPPIYNAEDLPPHVLEHGIILRRP